MEKVITYTNSDGDELNGVLTKGDTSKCVIFTHGFLSDKDENTSGSILGGAVKAKMFHYRLQA